MKQDETEETDNQLNSDYYREYAPFESGPAFLGRQLKRKDRVQLNFVIKGVSDFRSAQAFEQELLLWKKKEFQFWLRKLQSNSSDEKEEGKEVIWRLSGVSKPIKLPSEKDFFQFIGRLWDMGAHYGGRLESCSFSIAT